MAASFSLTPSVLNAMAVNTAGGSVTVGLSPYSEVLPQPLAEVKHVFAVQARRMADEARRLHSSAITRGTTKPYLEAHSMTAGQQFCLLWRLESAPSAEFPTLHVNQVTRARVEGDPSNLYPISDNEDGSEVKITEDDGRLHVSVYHRQRGGYINQYETATVGDSQSDKPDTSTFAVSLKDHLFYDLVRASLGEAASDLGSNAEDAIWGALLLSAQFYASNPEYYEDGFRLESADHSVSILVYIDTENNTVTLDNRKEHISFKLDKPETWELPGDFGIDPSNFFLRSGREIKDDGHAFMLGRVVSAESRGFIFQESRLVDADDEDEGGDGLNTLSPRMTEILTAEKTEADNVVAGLTQ